MIDELSRLEDITDWEAVDKIVFAYTVPAFERAHAEPGDATFEPPAG